MWKEELGKPHYLYILLDPRTDTVCYVGITKQEFKKRLLQHRNPKITNQASIAKLQRHLKSKGLTLNGEILAKGSEEFISALEKYVITGYWRYLGRDSIKNHQIGGRDSFGFAPESKQKAWETINRKRKEGAYESRQGEKSSSNKLTEKQVLEIYSLIKQFYSNSEIIEKLNLTVGLTGLNQIRHGKNWVYLWEQEKMEIIPSLKKEAKGLPSPEKIKLLKDIVDGVSTENIKIKYKLRTTDINRTKEKILWKPVWEIFNKYYNK